MSFGKLYGYPENSRTIALLIVAKENNLDIELVVENPSLGLSKEYLERFPKKKIPGFLGSDGFCLTETNAIAIYFASQNEKTTLLGKTKQEYASILQWMSFANTDLIRSIALWFFPLVGRMPYSKKVVDENQEEANRLCKYINCFLKSRTFFVGERLTLADLVMAAHLTPGFLTVFGAEWRRGFPNLVRWYLTVVNQPIWTAALPVPVMIEEPVKYVPKEPENETVPAKSDSELEESSAKELNHTSNSSLPRSFVLDEWKRQFSNNDLKTAMQWFWQHLDTEAYSLWRLDYKYNDELGLIFQSSNLCGGFFQRLDASRKSIFGSLVVYGQNRDNIISGVFLIKGKDFKPVFDVAPDWESYDFVSLDPAKEEDRRHIESVWGRNDPIEINGRIYVAADGKIFK
ncbi:hypothetical protein T552_00235 [Pneumocystis carinii B80]|uniref:Elongation factor 1-gamma n=1 Tax=Pneumocystis carinii (strain B80) TaxID=1408658 RepID=A0A0W4ZTA2_PNEC8|nr:hypothetical protein T552_00235 [Pneumocystis carinii B80]KTW31597.1 hypothetical protein T552_00235 [Pneumocystis carinii B80]